MFNMKQIPIDSTIIFIGKRGSGKSHLIQDFMRHHRHISSGNIISGTEYVDPYYSKFFPDIAIYKEYRPEIVEGIMEEQTRVLGEAKKKGVSHKDIKNPKYAHLLLLDDCMHDKKKWKNTEFKEIFTNGRHYNIQFLLAMQYPMGIGPELRTNVDYIFILRDNIKANKKRIHDSYAGIFPKFTMFEAVMDDLTQNYGCMVIDNKSQSTDISEVVYWYKAPAVIKPFKFGSKMFWEYQKKKIRADRKKKDKNKQSTANYRKNKMGIEKLGANKAEQRDAKRKKASTSKTKGSKVSNPKGSKSSKVSKVSKTRGASRRETEQEKRDRKKAKKRARKKKKKEMQRKRMSLFSGLF